MSRATELAEAQTALAAVKAELANAKSVNNYRMGEVSGGHRPIEELLRLEQYWQNEVARLSASGRNRVRRLVVRG